MKAFIIRRDSKPPPSLMDHGLHSWIPDDTRYQGTRMSEYVRMTDLDIFGCIRMYFASGRQFAMDAAIIAPYLDDFVSRLLDLLLVRTLGDALEILPFAMLDYLLLKHP